MGKRSNVPGNTARHRAVISGVPFSVSMEELKTEMKRRKELDAKHNVSKRNRERTEMMSVIIDFEHDLPYLVKLCQASLITM